MSQEKKLLIPNEGLVIRDPLSGQPLPAEGKEFVVNSYWKRRISDGDVTVGKKKKAKAKSKESND